MKFKGMIGSMFSGSSGGVTASHNRGGYYLRQRVVPSDPASTLQLKVRSAMTRTSVRASTGVASTKIRLVVYIAQTKSGRRNHVMPGARR